MSEIWKSVVGYEGYYEVSNQGRVRSLDRIATDGRKCCGRVLKLIPIGPHKEKYLSVMLSHGGVVKCVHVHAEVLRAFAGARPAGKEARHLDGHPANNRLTNLRWGTVAENTADKHRHSRMRNRKRHWSAKVGYKEVTLIRKLCARKVLQRVIAARFGIGKQQVSNIARRVHWK